MFSTCNPWFVTLMDTWFGSVWFSTGNTLFDPVQFLIGPCLTHDSSQFDPWFIPVWPMIRPCLFLSTLFDYIDPLWVIFRPTIWPCLSLSTLFDSQFDTVRLMIRPIFCLWSTHDSSIYDLIDPTRLMNGPLSRFWSTNDSSLFDLIDPARLMVRPLSRFCSNPDSNVFERIEPT